jgi:hypothetical protein
MKLNKKKTAGIIVVCAALVCGTAKADLFGFTDAAMLVQMVQEVSLLTNILTNSERIISNGENTFNTLRNAAVNITHKNSWIPAITPWQVPTALNTYGNTAGWMMAVTNGSNPVAGYSAVAAPLQPFASLWNTYSPTQQSVIAQRYGMVQVADGITANALGQNGQIRTTADQSQLAITKLATATSSDDPSLNTEVGVLNQISAAGIVQARQQTQTTQALTSLVDIQAAELAAQRNEAAAQINDEINFKTAHRAISSQLGGDSAALQGYIPQ